MSALWVDVENFIATICNHRYPNNLPKEPVEEKKTSPQAEESGLQNCQNGFHLAFEFVRGHVAFFLQGRNQCLFGEGVVVLGIVGIALSTFWLRLTGSGVMNHPHSFAFVAWSSAPVVGFVVALVG